MIVICQYNCVMAILLNDYFDRDVLAIGVDELIGGHFEDRCVVEGPVDGFDTGVAAGVVEGILTGVFALLPLRKR